MTYGEIKIEALKLMFANIGDDIDASRLDTYATDEQYRYYLVNMPGAINRCLARIEEKRVLPSKATALRLSEGLASGAFVRFDLSGIGDLYDIERVVCEDSCGGYDENSDFRTEGNHLVLPRYDEKDGLTYTLIYKPTVKRVTSATGDDEKIGIPDSIAAYIPYFVKGDLYRDDEPNEASEARNWFEQALDEMQVKRTAHTGRVKTLYTQVGQ